MVEGRHGVSRAGRPNPDELSPEDTRWIVEASNRFDLDLLDVKAEGISDMGKRAHSIAYENS